VKRLTVRRNKVTSYRGMLEIGTKIYVYLSWQDERLRRVTGLGPEKELDWDLVPILQQLLPCFLVVKPPKTLGRFLRDLIQSGGRASRMLPHERIAFMGNALGRWFLGEQLEEFGSLHDGPSGVGVAPTTKSRCDLMEIHTCGA